MKSGVLESFCMDPPMSIESILWNSFISNLKLGLDFTKESGNLEIFIGKYKGEYGLNEIKKDVENFLDCIKEEGERINKFYRNKKEVKPEMPKKICGNINYLDLQCKLINYSKTKDENNSEKFHCKLIADLRFASQIILGKEKGPLGSYGKVYEGAINYLEVNRPRDSWEKDYL